MIVVDKHSCICWVVCSFYSDDSVYLFVWDDVDGDDEDADDYWCDNADDDDHLAKSDNDTNIDHEFGLQLLWWW